jgi:hypothetical protein
MDGWMTYMSDKNEKEKKKVDMNKSHSKGQEAVPPQKMNKQKVKKEAVKTNEKKGKTFQYLR